MRSVIRFLAPEFTFLRGFDDFVFRQYKETSDFFTMSFIFSYFFILCHVGFCLLRKSSVKITLLSQFLPYSVFPCDRSERGRVGEGRTVLDEQGFYLLFAKFTL